MRARSLLAVVAVLASGCGTRAHASPPGSTYDRLVIAYRAYAACARTHGLPNLPDPHVDAQGNDSYPLMSGRFKWPASVIRGCSQQWQRVHAIRDRFDSEHVVKANPAEFRKAIAFARCVRRHGFPSFPDPDASGRFVTNVQGFDKLHLSPQARAATNACRQR